MSHWDVRYVIFHHPGPAWRSGVDFREQPGMMAHVNYFRSLTEKKMLAFGGPFLDNRGGMVVPSPQLSEKEIEKLAENDPAISSGLLVYDIRPWFIAMRAER